MLMPSESITRLQGKTLLGKGGRIERRPSLHMSASTRKEVTVAAQCLCGLTSADRPCLRDFESLWYCSSKALLQVKSSKRAADSL